MKSMKKLILIIVVILFYSCNDENFYLEEINGNKMTITRRIKDKIGSDVTEYEKIEIIKIRIDDDAEYHITYKNLVTNRIELIRDVSNHRVILSDGVGDSWILPISENFKIVYPVNKIEYFED